MKTARVQLPSPDAFRLMSAELWLRLGEPVQALLELRKLTKSAAKHPWTERILQLARRVGY
jgi:hypothetical protein